MADEPNAAASNAGGGQGAADVPAVVPPVDPKKIELGGGDSTGGENDGANAPNWREDWREALAGEDKQAFDRLQRFASPADLFKSYREVEKRLSSRQTSTLPEGATPEEVAAHRKALGIPETPEGYGLTFPAELQADESASVTLKAYQEHMHALHIPPAAAQAAFDFYLKDIQANRERSAEAAQENTLQNVAELRKEYPGREFRRNMTIAEDFLATHFEGSEQALDLVMNARLPDGVPIKSYAPFIKGLVAMARSYAPEEALIGGDGAGGGKSIDDRYNELVAKSAGARLSKDENAELMKLSEARVAREEKQGRARAA